jgi:hypothetical protein
MIDIMTEPDRSENERACRRRRGTLPETPLGSDDLFRLAARSRLDLARTARTGAGPGVAATRNAALSLWPATGVTGPTRRHDWELLLALHLRPEPWDGLITTDSSILNQGPVTVIARVPSPPRRPRPSPPVGAHQCHVGGAGLRVVAGDEGWSPELGLPAAQDLRVRSASR